MRSPRSDHSKDLFASFLYQCAGLGYLRRVEASIGEFEVIRASGLHSLDDRDKDRLLFTWPTGKAEQVQKTMERACKAAGTAHYHPHDLRHRRVSLWHKQGQSWAEIGAKVGATPKVLADTYTHVLAGAEVPDEAMNALLVWSRCGLEAPAS